jgi:very-short-patch-repair endonuclease
MISLEEIELARTPRGGRTRKQLQHWGIMWPPPKGWKQMLTTGKIVQAAGARQCYRDCRVCNKLRSLRQFPPESAKCKKCIKAESKILHKVKRCEDRSKPATTIYAQQMRQNMTPAEDHLWRKLQNLSPLFLPQVVVFGYIADFCCFSRKVIVEVDGEYHTLQGEKDRQRDLNLMKRGFRTLRFTNGQVFNSRPLVLGQIIEAL